LAEVIDIVSDHCWKCSQCQRSKVTKCIFAAKACISTVWRRGGSRVRNIVNDYYIQSY